MTVYDLKQIFQSGEQFKIVQYILRVSDKIEYLVFGHRAFFGKRGVFFKRGNGQRRRYAVRLVPAFKVV